MADNKKEVRPLANPLIETSSKHANISDAAELINKTIQDHRIVRDESQDNRRED